MFLVENFIAGHSLLTPALNGLTNAPHSIDKY